MIIGYAYIYFTNCFQTMYFTMTSASQRKNKELNMADKALDFVPKADSSRVADKKSLFTNVICVVFTLFPNNHQREWVAFKDGV